MPRPQRLSNPRRTAALVAGSENPHVRRREVVTTPPFRAASAASFRPRVSVQYSASKNRLDGNRRLPTLSVHSIWDWSLLDGNRGTRQANHGNRPAPRAAQTCVPFLNEPLQLSPARRHIP